MAQQSWTADSSSSTAGFRTIVAVSNKVVHAAQPMMKFRQFTSIEDAFGKNKGESVEIYRAANTDVESDSSPINELDRIPTTRMGVTGRLITVNEWGRAIPFTGKLETLAEVDVESNVYLKGLRNHMAKTLDRRVASVFKGSDLIAIPTGATTVTWDVDGTASTSATVNLNVFHLKEIVDAMKTGIFGSGNVGRPVPFYAEEYYVMIGSVKAIRGLKDDSDYEVAAKYADAEGLYRGEIGRMPFYNVRIIETNHTNALSNGVGTGSVLGEAVFFGEDPVREAVAIPEEIRAKIPEDFDRDKALAWYAILDWGRVWDFSSDSEEHIIRVASS